MRKRTSAAEQSGRQAPIRIVLVTMDTHIASATQRAKFVVVLVKKKGAEAVLPVK